jgi:mannose-6-phosphate isomerase-like protein (cupin superfamily)
MEIHEKVWGEEHWIVNNPEYCGKKLIIKKGFRCSLHLHKIKHETFYVHSGRVLMEHRETSKILYAGDTITIDRNDLHRFTGLDDLNEIFEFSTQHFEDDSYRMIESGEVSQEELNLVHHCYKNSWAENNKWIKGNLSFRSALKDPLWWAGVVAIIATILYFYLREGA